MKNASLFGFTVLFLSGIILGIALYGAYEYYHGVFPGSQNRIIAQQSSVHTNSYGLVSPDGVKTPHISVPILAVNSREDIGVVGNVTSRIIPGDGHILIQTDPFIEPDLQYSLDDSLAVAQKVSGMYLNGTDIVFSYNIPGDVIGGPSAGAMTTVAVIALLEDKSIRNDTVMTGTINPDGTIGEVGGLPEKAQAAANAGYKVFLVPKGQSKVTTYEKNVAKDVTADGRIVYTTTYIPTTKDLHDMINGTITIKEVQNIQDAQKLLIE